MSDHGSDKATPRVSVIVPNYNHERFLHDRLQSVFDQTFQDFEVIYLDDASTDASNRVAAAFADDSRMHIHAFTTNSGNPFFQWNRGVELARGELVWIAESDDLAEAQLLEGLVRALDAEPDAGLAYCRSQPFDPDGHYLADDLQWPEPAEAAHWENDYVNDGRDEIARFAMLRSTIPNASAVVFRRELFRTIGGAPLDYRYAGDWVTWLKMMLRGKLCYVNSIWNYHRKHPSTVTSGAALDGRWAEEGYRVIGFLMEQMELPEPQLERALDRLMVKWVASWVHPDSRIDDARQAALHAAASPVDRRLVRRALQNVMLSKMRRRLALVWDLMQRSR